jgi:hypothetical protein
MELDPPGNRTPFKELNSWAKKHPFLIAANFKTRLDISTPLKNADEKELFCICM